MKDQNPFIWHELVTTDQKKSGQFFSDLLGWGRKEVRCRPVRHLYTFPAGRSGCSRNDESDTRHTAIWIVLAFVHRSGKRRRVRETLRFAWRKCPGSTP